MTTFTGRPNLYTPIHEWLSVNRNFYSQFRRWLRDGGYSDSTLTLYGTAARLALGWLDTAYWLIDPDADLDRVREIIAAHYESEGTRSTYFKGLAKLAEYLRYRCHRPAVEKPINWGFFLDSLPQPLAQEVRTYIAHCQRAWLPEKRYPLTCTALSHLTLFLRWMARQEFLNSIGDLTPARWWEYVDTRLAAGISPVTLNGELRALQQFLRFLADQDRPDRERGVLTRMLRLASLKTNRSLPQDVPLDQLRLLLQAIEAEIASNHARHRRMGLLDRAWVFTMIHSGLRVGEVRRLRLSDLDLKGKKVRIEQSKGLKDRIVCLSTPAVEALRAYLQARGPATTDHVFLYRHLPLSSNYCNKRLGTYGKRCGVLVKPHQLRHTCATLLLNAGAPILTVQTILGHKFIDTTLGYARLYDGTVAADYYRAMAEIEGRFEGGERAGNPPD
ncbi:MAG: tyrosine-type recombinase/integrase, partial [Anaerolineae bacterium]|nr:tyrosine-type recombinase/integrase [Anaerolineae bacterium]